MGKHTPLYDVHVAAGAKLVDFAGWDMPIHYGSQIEEHHGVRNDAGMFDVSHMLGIDLSGADAQRWLRRLLANDVARLTLPGKALYSCMLREDGGVIDDLIVYFFSPDRYRIVVNAGTADKDLAWMRQQAAGWQVQLEARRDLAMIAVQGPRAREKFWEAFPIARSYTEPLMPFQALEVDSTLIEILLPNAEDDTWLVARTGYTGEDGLELAVPAAQAVAIWQDLAAAGVAPAGLGARDTLRLEAGMNLYGQDMDETVGPLESGLAWTVELRDAGRDFIGRKALEASVPQRRLAGLVLLDRGVLRAHQTVHTTAGNGDITSGSFSPTLGVSIALARLPAGVKDDETVAVEIRDKRLRARVVKAPFVRNGKALISTKELA